ncbi:MAG: hypothetical protein OSA98_11120 [Rubripirellula sp.]|nr:hypothetical protein [Rubripirellula sp.]
MVADHLPLPVLFSECAGGTNRDLQWLTVASNVLTDLVVANDADVPSDDKAEFLGWTLPPSFRLACFTQS